MPDTQTSSQPEQIDLGAEAVRLAELGYAVFPCCDPRNDDSPVGNKGKKPLTSHGVNGATTDLDQIAELGPLSPVSIAKTGSGGRHLFFARPDAEISGQTTVKWHGEPTGIDIRVGSQYVIVAPSLHESGKHYSWEKPLVAPEELTPLPQT